MEDVFSEFFSEFRDKVPTDAARSLMPAAAGAAEAGARCGVKTAEKQPAEHVQPRAQDGI